MQKKQNILKIETYLALAGQNDTPKHKGHIEKQDIRTF